MTRVYLPTVAYCLIQDDDTHWYLIPHKAKKLFNTLLYDVADDYEAFNAEFGEYRVDGPHRIVFYKPEERD